MIAGREQAVSWMSVWFTSPSWKKNKEGERKEDYDTHLNKKCKKHEDALYLQIRHTLIYTSTHIRIYLH